MEKFVNIIGGGLAGSEAAIQLAMRGVRVNLFEMRPMRQTPVHAGGKFAELVCSNSLKSMKPDKPAGMLKHEMALLGSRLLSCACDAMVPAGGALAVDREVFSDAVVNAISENPLITHVVGEVVSISQGCIEYLDARGDRRSISGGYATIIATGPLTSDALAQAIQELSGKDHMAFYDAAAPIVMADSLDEEILFRQSRYGEEGAGDYLNAPFEKDEYDRFIKALLEADRVIARDFETRDLFSACQPIEEIARRGHDAPRHGMMKPVGLTDPRTGRRPYAAVQLRAEDAHSSSYNLVGFQTNLTFPSQRAVFRLIPGLEHAEFARYGVMHRNTFIDAPSLLDSRFRLKSADFPLYFAGQVSGTEGYCEAIMSGLYVALNVYAQIHAIDMPSMPPTSAFGSLVAYATNPSTCDYQPMHVNFGVYPPLDKPIKNKGMRYQAFTQRERDDMRMYVDKLIALGLLDERRLKSTSRLSQALEKAGMSSES